MTKQSELKTSEDVYKYAQDNKEAIFKQYSEKHGGYVNPDDFRDYINDNKRLQASITHEGASSLADQYFEKLVAEHPNGKGIVVAGGPGGGKGTSIKALGIDKQGADILVDKTKGNKELKKMLDAGMEVDYYVVVPDADKIVSNIIGRAARGGAGGRTLPINSMGIPTHKKVAEIVKDLYKEGTETGKFNVKFIDNAGKIEEINLKEGIEGYKLLEQYAGKLDNITEDVVKKEAKKWLDAGKITPDQYKALIASIGGILFIGSILNGESTDTIES